jgi:nucleoside-diphosphate-sugar epimerase
MRIFLAGGSGAIGTRLVPKLVARGHAVVATTRTPAKAARLEQLGAEPVVLDIVDRTATVAAVTAAAPDVVVHQVTVLAAANDLKHFDRTFAGTNAARTKGLDNLLEAARAAGARRFVAQSYTGWPNAREGARVKTESDPLHSHPLPNESETLAAIKYLERTVATADDLDGVVLRYGGFYGPGTSLASGGEHAEMVRKRRFPIVGDGEGVWSFVHIDDAADATVLAIERGARGIYNIVDDDPAPVSEWLPYLAEQLGAKPPRHLPAWVAKAAVGDVGIAWMTETRGSSNAKAKAELGWRPHFASWRDGFRYGLDEATTSEQLGPLTEAA